MALVTGTIRKAQNLLKQYSQHGLDGKKGGSNLIPLEGNHPVLPPPSIVCLSLTHQAGQSLPQEGRETDPTGLGGSGKHPWYPSGLGRPEDKFHGPGPAWLCPS